MAAAGAFVWMELVKLVATTLALTSNTRQRTTDASR
jgi:hypothetical protein